jgi:hypothetical protein
MTTSSETALGKISRYISSTGIEPTARSLEFVRDALIDTYGCNPIVSSSKAMVVASW